MFFPKPRVPKEKAHPNYIEAVFSENLLSDFDAEDQVGPQSQNEQTSHTHSRRGSNSL
jgi:hypothetical protein